MDTARRLADKNVPHIIDEMIIEDVEQIRDRCRDWQMLGGMDLDSEGEMATIIDDGGELREIYKDAEAEQLPEQ